MTMDQHQTYGRPIGASVTATYTDTAGTTSALPVDTTVVRVVSTTACFIEISTDPTAVADTSMYMAALTPEYFAAQSGTKVSAIQVSTGGSIYVTPF